MKNRIKLLKNNKAYEESWNNYRMRENVFIEYMYSFANGETANVIIRPNDMENCIRVLTEKKVDLLAASDLYKL